MLKSVINRTAPNSCPVYTVQINTVQFITLNFNTRSCKNIVVVWRQASKQSSSPESISVPLGYSTYLDTSKDYSSLAQRHVKQSIVMPFMLRYARIPLHLPTSCVGCGESQMFDVNHDLDIAKKVVWPQLDTTKFMMNSEIY